MSKEIPKIPDTADELLAKIDEAKAAKRQKTPEQVGQQINRIAGKLIDRAEAMGPDLYHDYDNDEADRLAVLPGPGTKKPRVKSLLMHDSETGVAKSIMATKGKTEIRWSDGPATSTYGTPGRNVRIETRKRPFKPPEVGFKTGIELGRGRTHYVKTSPEDISQVAGVLSEMRGGLAQKAIDAAEERAERGQK